MKIAVICLLIVMVAWTWYCLKRISKQYTSKPLTLKEMEKYHHTIISSETAEELASQSTVTTVDVLNPSGKIVRLGLINGKTITFKVKDY